MDRAKGRRNVQLVALRVVGSQIRRADLLESRHCRIKRGGATRESELENTCVRRVFRSVWSDPALHPFTGDEGCIPRPACSRAVECDGGVVR